jgi:hypothetical protein
MPQSPPELARVSFRIIKFAIIVKKKFVLEILPNSMEWKRRC